MKVARLILICVVLLATVAGVQAQHLNGQPAIDNFDKYAYQAHNQNWAIVQDSRGVMYFGNRIGLLEYDGSNWILYDKEINPIIRSIEKDKNGLLMLGTSGDFGYVAPDAAGEVKFYSLKNKVPADYRDFGDVVKVHVSNDGVYFQSLSLLFYYDYDTITVIKPETGFHLSFMADGVLYVREPGVGLHLVSGNKNLQLIKGGEVFGALRIYTILPYNNTHLLAGTREDGFYLIDKSDKEPPRKLEMEVSGYLAQTQLYSGLRFPNKNYAFSTLSGGVVITDPMGNIQQVIDVESGLLGNTVYGLYLDMHESLWAVLDNGIARIDISSPITFFNNATGIRGTLECVNKFDDRLFVGTSDGLFYAKKPSEIKPEDEFSQLVFVQVDGIFARCWDMLPVNLGTESKLMVATQDGLFLVDEKFSVTNIEGGHFYKIYQSEKYPKRILVGGDGLSSFSIENNKLRFEDYFSYIEEEIKTIAEDSLGDIWFSATAYGVVRLVNNKSSCFEKLEADTVIESPWKEKYKIKYYADSVYNLPSLIENKVFGIGEKVYFGTLNGLMQFNYAAEKFEYSQRLGKQLGDSTHQVAYMKAEADGNVLVETFNHNENTKEFGVARRQAGDKYTWYSLPFRQLNSYEIYNVYTDADNIVWMATSEELLRYNERVKKDYQKKYSAILRLVKVFDDTLYEGSYCREINFKGKKFYTFANTQPQVPELTYDRNSLSFYFAAAVYENSNSIEYTYFLDGNDKGWSKWTNESKKEYTNLAPGTYTFRVKAKNLYGTVSDEVQYRFVIEPPFWQRWWFYASEISFFALLLVVTIAFNRSKSNSRWATFLTFIVILLVFEFINNSIDAYVDLYTGGVPVFKMLMNVALALLLNPLENLISKIISGKQ